ncbi:hypothetical protein T440DRAFT_113656 [Plenodomus tracheiphilus IPT5]|uniref:Uncharacterized protein n=1 Tax=Plenodomus tracheiphilus IPT5 TaxID=1408161 RepID=A0A6A7B440_9PLEO|nr:hypothetical protein T440DRAFT_113656 [Plenodomus tracheiphilus IPT5]
MYVHVEPCLQATGTRGLGWSSTVTPVWIGLALAGRMLTYYSERWARMEVPVAVSAAQKAAMASGQCFYVCGQAEVARV